MKKQDFELFNDIQHRPLRTYNRVVMANNLTESLGKEVGKQYMDFFSQPEREEMFTMGMYIKVKGVKFVYSAVTRDLEVVDEDYVPAADPDAPREELFIDEAQLEMDLPRAG